jgi:uncharacterized protein (TIGR02145 family)
MNINIHSKYRILNSPRSKNMETKPFTFCLIAVVCITLVLTVGCEKEETKDDGTTIPYGTLKDIDGNLYRTTEIGRQEWMAENLKVTKYNDGQDILPYWTPGEITISEESRSETGRYGIYPHEQIDGIESDDEVIKAYGLHYNWYAVESEKLCPAGWHVPRLDDWEELLGYLTDNYDHIDNWIDAGISLKSCRQTDSPLMGDCNTSVHPRWNPDGINYWLLEMQQSFPDFEYPGGEFIWPLAGTDEFGFSALPAGKYSPHQIEGIFGSHGVGYLSGFWIDHKTKWDPETFMGDFPEITEGDEMIVIVEDEITHKVIFKNGLGISGSSLDDYGYSVRCVRLKP